MRRDVTMSHEADVTYLYFFFLSVVILSVGTENFRGDELDLYEYLVMSSPDYTFVKLLVRDMNDFEEVIRFKDLKNLLLMRKKKNKTFDFKF